MSKNLIKFYIVAAFAVFAIPFVGSAQVTPDTTTVEESQDVTADVTTVEEDSFVPDADTTTVEENDEFTPDADTTTVEENGDNSEEPVEETTNRSGRAHRGGSSSSNVPRTPSVLGASVGPNGEILSCSPYLVTFMRIGQANNVDEVKKLQSFLNETMGSNLPLSGFFGTMTHEAVMKLHAQHADQILRPWDTAGLSVNLQPTGYAYKTTQWFINSSMCKGTTIPKPVLK